MSRIRLLVSAILCLSFGGAVGFGQGLYVTVNGAYGLGAGTQRLSINNRTTETPQAYEGVYGSLGEGAKFGVSGGYMFTDHFAAELGFSYWLGKKIESANKFSNGSSTYDVSGGGFLAVPSLVFLSNLKPVNLYGKFGLVLGLLKSTEEVSVVNSSGTLELTREQTGGLAVGFAGALGFIVPTGGVVDFFAEVVLHSLTYSPNKQEITQYTVDGQDQLSTLQQTSVDYRDSYTSNDRNVNIGERRPFSSIGFSAGVRVAL